MSEPANGFEFLEWLRTKNGKQVQNYQDLSRYLDAKARDKGVPIHGQFELTPLCNFRCRMCYVQMSPEQLNGRAVMSVQGWKDLMSQACEAGMLHVTLTGGECLAYPGFDELFLFLQSMGCDVSILTNGYLLNEQRIRFFTEHMPHRIQITMYGWNDDVYERVTGQRAFTTVADNARRAVEADLPVILNVTPSSFLGEDVLETVRAARQITRAVTVNSAIFSPREETGRSGQKDDPETEMYLKIYRLMYELDGLESREISEDRLPPAGGPSHECAECGLKCGGGRSSFVLNWKGVLMACNRMHMLQADALKEGFAAAWRKVNREANSWPRVPECEGCPYAGVCNNCAANILSYAEPGKQPLALCERTKYLVRHGVRHIPECE